MHSPIHMISCKQHKVTLNEQKFQFCMKEVNFAGFLLGWDSYSPAESVLQAISGFPMPEAPTITDIRAWFGLVNQLSPFFATSQLMEPFRELLKPFRELLKSPKSVSKKIYWNEKLKHLFEKSKAEICEKAMKGLTYFNTTSKICVQTDCSKTGIGFIVLQQTCSCNSDTPDCCTGSWQLILCGSRYLKQSEQNYAVIEGEALAVA